MLGVVEGDGFAERQAHLNLTNFASQTTLYPHSAQSRTSQPSSFLCGLNPAWRAVLCDVLLYINLYLSSYIAWRCFCCCFAKCAKRGTQERTINNECLRRLRLIYAYTPFIYIFMCVHYRWVQKTSEPVLAILPVSIQRTDDEEERRWLTWGGNGVAVARSVQISFAQSNCALSICTDTHTYRGSTSNRGGRKCGDDERFCSQHALPFSADG